jgi:zinc transporter ZupT
MSGTFYRSGFTFKKIIGLIIAFSFSTPIGMSIGVVLSEQNPIVGSILLAISSGTFIYVSCTEIIQHEFERGLRQWIQFIFVTLGGAFIIGLWFLGGESGHAHGGTSEKDCH